MKEKRDLIFGFQVGFFAFFEVYDFCSSLFIHSGRVYLGMHSLIDVVAGISFGLVIFAFWLMVHGYVDEFIISGQNGEHQNSNEHLFSNVLELIVHVDFMLFLLFICFSVTYFWASLSLLLSFAYPNPELPTPSFEYHTAFNGVAFGIVSINISLFLALLLYNIYCFLSCIIYLICIMAKFSGIAMEMLLLKYIFVYNWHS